MPETSTARRSRTHLALWLLWTLFAIWAALRVTGLGTVFPWIQLLAYTPLAAAASLLPLGAALLTRRWRTAVTAAVVTIVLAACVLPRALADDTRAGGGPRLRVLSANMLAGGADPAAIVALVRRHHIDLLALQELTPEGQRALDAAGLTELLAHRVTYPHEGVVGSGLFSRFPLRDDGLRVHGSGFTQAKATISVPGSAAVEVESVHPCAPAALASDACWAPDQANQPPATVDGPVRLLVGDFNATLDHQPLRRLIATGYRDAADVRGAGLTPTWPFDGKPIPKATIDHVLADRRIGVTDYAVHPLPGSDHRAVLAALVLPERQVAMGAGASARP